MYLVISEEDILQGIYFIIRPSWKNCIEPEEKSWMNEGRDYDRHLVGRIVKNQMR